MTTFAPCSAEQLGGRAADAARGPGDDRDLVVEDSHVSLLLVACREAGIMRDGSTCAWLRSRPLGAALAASAQAALRSRPRGERRPTPPRARATRSRPTRRSRPAVRAAPSRAATCWCPFDVPGRHDAGAGQVLLRPARGPTAGAAAHARPRPVRAARDGDGCGEREFRGWGGSSHPDVTVTPQGFSTEAEYLRRARRATCPAARRAASCPGPIPAGRWAAELGVAAVVAAGERRPDGKVAWRVEIELASDPAFAADPYMPAPLRLDARRAEAGLVRGRPARARRALGARRRDDDARSSTTRSRARRGARLRHAHRLRDDVRLGRDRPLPGRYPGKLIARVAEVITYRGHTNNHVSRRYVDYRTGPVYERARRRARRAARGRAARRARIFARSAARRLDADQPPDDLPVGDAAASRTSAAAARGTTRRTRPTSAKVDAIEVAHRAHRRIGDAAPNPFTLTAIDFYERALRRAAAASPRSASATRTTRAARGPDRVADRHRAHGLRDELSERGVQRAIEAGHTYVKSSASAGPTCASPATAGRARARSSATRRAARSLELTARATGGGVAAARAQRQA